jgi:hypothetical protein
VGDPDASAGRREGLQEVLANEASELQMKRKALEKIDWQANEQRGFDTVKVQ